MKTKVFKVFAVVSLMSLNTHASKLTLNEQEYNALYSDQISTLESVYQHKLANVKAGGDEALLKASLMAYRIGPMFLPKEKAKARKYFKDCVKHAKAISPKSDLKAEGFALSAFCYALQINLNPMRAASLGSAYQASMETALAFDADNAHVQLIAAILDSFTPKRYGGDLDKGISRLHKILPQVEQAKELHWLLPDIHSYLSFSYIKKQNIDKAEYHLEEAKKLVPNYPFIANVLSPRMQKLVAKQDQETLKKETE